MVILADNELAKSCCTNIMTTHMQGILVFTTCLVLFHRSTTGRVYLMTGSCTVVRVWCVEYLVKWFGYGLFEVTWELAANLANAAAVLADFLAS